MSFHTTPELDLASLDNDIIAQDLTSPVETSPEPTPADTPAVETQAEEPTPEPEPAPAPKADDDIPTDIEELKRGYMRTRDYTRKRMEEAAAAKEVEAQRAQLQAEIQARQQELAELAAWRQLGADPNNLEAFAQQLKAKSGVDPETPLTYQQAQQLAAQVVEQRLTAEREEAQKRAYAEKVLEYENRYLEELTEHTTAALDAAPLVKRFPGAARAAVEEARASGPKSMKEFKTRVTDIIKSWQAAEEKLIKDYEQAAIMRHAKTNKPTIEPPGGGIPANRAPVKEYDIGSDELHMAILQDLMAGN